jgi:SAM-dependent methyltransferase
MSDTRPSHFFDAIAGRYDREYALATADSRARLRRLLAALPSAPARVLDLGVGTGRELTTLLDAGYVPTGLDASSAMLERCARRARPVPLVTADFWEPFPFEDGAFDAVIALHGTLAHPPAEGAMARLAGEVARVTRRGGTFFAETPSVAWLEVVESVGDGDRGARRTGPRTCIYEDRVARASIEARILDEDEWRQAFGPPWTLRFETLGALEIAVIGHRD